MRKTNPLDPALPVWTTDDGSPLSCTEKIKVLNENMREIEALVRDMLEDGVLMGCSDPQMRSALKALIDTVTLRF